MLIITVLLGIIFFVPQSVQAQEIITDGRVPAGTVVENDVFVFGDDIVVDGDVDGELFAFGSSVTINGNVSGSILSVAGTVDVNGEVDGSIYALGRDLTLGSEASTGRNLYFAGIRLTLSEGAMVGRDLVGVSLSAKINGTIGRDINIISGLLSFADLLAAPESESPSTEDEPAPTEEPDASDSESSSAGYLVLTSTGYSKPLFKEAVQTSDDTGELKSSQKQGVTAQAVLDWTLERLEVFITLLILGGVAVWLIPTRMEHWSETVKVKPGLSTGFGLLSLVIVVNAMAIAILLAILIVIIGLWLGAVTFWSLAFIFWGIAFSILGLGVTLFIVFVWYISKAIVAYLVGTQILKRVSERAAGYKLLVLALGLLIYVILAGLPYIGGFISFLATVLGLGAILVAYRDKKYTEIRAEGSSDAHQEAASSISADESATETGDEMPEDAEEEAVGE
jgi:cytoskeletal protein CcmA (bactofilin family)